MSDYRGRSSRGRSSRGRGGPRGGFRGRGGYSSEFRGRGGYRGRGDGFSRGRGGPRHSSRDDDSPPRKVPMMSRGYDSDRGRGPPLSKSRRDRFDDDFERSLPSRSRDLYSSPPRESSRLLDRLSPLRTSLRDRDFGTSSRDFLLSPRISLSGDSGSFRDAFSSSLREDRRENLGRPRDFISPRSSGDYIGEKSSRDFRDSTRDFGSRDYPPRSSDFREPLRRDVSPRDRSAQHGYSTERSYNPERSHNSDREFSSRGGRGGHISRHSSDLLDSRDHHHNGARDFSSSRFSKLDDRSSGRGPPREFKSHSGRGGMRDGRDDHGGRGGYMDSCQGIEWVREIQETGDAVIFEQQSSLLYAVDPVKHKEVYLIIHHNKTQIFTDVLDGTTVNEVKKMMEGILKLDPKHMMLYRDDDLLADGDLPVSSYGLTSSTASCFTPAHLRIVMTEE